MRRRTRNYLAAGLAIAGLAFAPLTNAQLFEGQRSHGDSKADMLGSELIAAGLTETTGPAECTDSDGDGTEDSVTVKDVTFQCENIDMLSFVPNSAIFADKAVGALGDGVSDIWGWESPAGEEYVIVGATNGAAVLRITDPEAPQYLGHVFNTGAQLIWFDIKINNDTAYIVSESPAMGMKILDLTLLDALPEVPAGTTVPLPVLTYPLDLTAHNVVINEDADMLYLVGSGQALGMGSVCTTDAPTTTDNAGLHAVDISTPLAPLYVGCHADEGYVHDAQCTTYTGPDADHTGKPICVTAHEDGVAWVDMSDPAAPVTLFDTATAEDSEALYPGVAYSHQGWMSEDQTRYFHGDELDEQDNGTPTRTFVYDMTDLDAVTLEFMNEPGGRNIDHNMYTHRGLLFQSNYTAGLQVFDQEPVVAEDGTKSLEMVAQFDIFPDCPSGLPMDPRDVACDEPVFAGTWSNYPYLDSNTLAVTATEDGVFFLRLDPAVEAAYPVDGEVEEAGLPTQAAERAREARTRGRG